MLKKNEYIKIFSVRINVVLSVFIKSSPVTYSKILMIESERDRRQKIEKRETKPIESTFKNETTK